MKYGKLKNGYLIYPPTFKNNIINYNKNYEQLKKDGYKEIIREETYPELKEGYVYKSEYEEKPDKIIVKITQVEQDKAIKIEELKNKLQETDYKIIKCSEYQLVGKEAPYDIHILHDNRQAIRDKINEIEGEVK